MKESAAKNLKSRETTYCFSSEWIHSLESEEHWRLYWQQQQLMKDKIEVGHCVLEIGVGSGFNANYLRSKGVEVTTMDIDADKQPDIVANIIDFDWGEMRFDHVLAFEVFEHIPFAEFTRVLGQLAAICKSRLFLSVPKCERVWFDLEFRLPLIGRHRLTLASKRSRIYEPHHFWELGSPGATSRDLHSAFVQHGFQLEDEVVKSSRVFISLKSAKP